MPKQNWLSVISFPAFLLLVMSHFCAGSFDSQSYLIDKLILGKSVYIYNIISVRKWHWKTTQTRQKWKNTIGLPNSFKKHSWWSIVLLHSFISSLLLSFLGPSKTNIKFENIFPSFCSFSGFSKPLSKKTTNSSSVLEMNTFGEEDECVLC